VKEGTKSAQSKHEAVKQKKRMGPKLKKTLGKRPGDTKREKEKVGVLEKLGTVS